MKSTNEVARIFAERLTSRDLRGFAELFADEFDWYVPGEPVLPWAGRRRTRAEMEAFFQELWPLTVSDQMRLAVTQVLAQDKDAVVLGRFSHVAGKTDKRFTLDLAFHIQVEGGRITRLRLYEDTLGAAAELGLLDLPCPPSTRG
ncbi:protein of unknown function DUF1486 [Desulfovibrio sp. X2]|uniref:nuclear transport factor 2 family protein n=1 Tax=Desulfovibrio sp. X2 TaxID=941449 RepID=UPI000358B250|nr:nuclear transport factor 2 family protein [Desulfovibrio sp. X2]EPR39657.1 protein of unknown function DUF1486 [Desulfovibrio sp. X2]